MASTITLNGSDDAGSEENRVVLDNQESASLAVKKDDNDDGPPRRPNTSLPSVTTTLAGDEKDNDKDKGDVETSESTTQLYQPQHSETDEEKQLNSSHHSAGHSNSSITDHHLISSDTETSHDIYTASYYPHSSNRNSNFRGVQQLQQQRNPLTEAFEYDDRPLDHPSRMTALNFCMEHRIFIKAALSLLTERDRQAPELGMLDPVVLRAGPLKKAAHLMNGVWKAKYVEIRRGMFSYYENNKENDELLRKNIPLEAGKCTCRPVKLHQKALNFTPLGAIFELSVSNNSNKNSLPSKRLWMANSRDERQMWMQAIHHAMVGGSVTRGNELPAKQRGPKPFDLRQYQQTQATLRNSRTMSEYINGLREILNQSLQVPVKWIVGGTGGGGGGGSGGGVGGGGMSGGSGSLPLLPTDSMDGAAFQEETIDMSVDQLWRDLQRDTVRIDGEVLRGDSGHGPERIVGALMRRILRVSRSAGRSLTESQALSYTRDALLAGNRTRTGGDSYFCINMLCRNPGLAVIVPSGREAEPTAFEVSEDESEHSFHTILDSKSGWIKTRSKMSRTWDRRFFVLSEGTLSYYEGALPRPHGLRGQLFLKDAVASVARRKDNTDQFVLSIAASEGTNRKEKALLFESEDSLIEWLYALECAAKSSKYNAELKASRKKMSQDEEMNSSFTDIQTNAQFSTLEHAANLGLDDDGVHTRLEKISRRAGSAVCISLRACTEYKICTADPQGDEELDNWATIRAHFLQTLRVTGGPNGRITRGEEVVGVSIVDCITLPATEQDLHDPPPSPSRRTRNRRLFRNTSQDGANLEAEVAGGLAEQNTAP